MIGAWEFSEYMLIVSILILVVNMVLYAHRVFFCRDVLLKNSGARFLVSIAVFLVMIVLLMLNFYACTAEPLTLWLGIPLLLGSVLVSLLSVWAFGQVQTA